LHSPPSNPADGKKSESTIKFHILIWRCDQVFVVAVAPGVKQDEVCACVKWSTRTSIDCNHVTAGQVMGLGAGRKQ
ncbi:hypothetical protein KI387_021746, partial [Taxus chinensis]